MQTVELRNTHTTKLRVALAYNEKGRSAGLPAQLCLKANFTGRATPLDICQLEARFYHDLVEGADVPAPVSYYSDWDEDGSGQGRVIMDDLIQLGGEVGRTYQHIGAGAVAGSRGHLTV